MEHWFNTSLQRVKFTEHHWIVWWFWMLLVLPKGWVNALNTSESSCLKWMFWHRHWNTEHCMYRLQSVKLPDAFKKHCFIVKVLVLWFYHQILINTKLHTPIPTCQSYPRLSSVGRVIIWVKFGQNKLKHRFLGLTCTLSLQ